MSAIKIPQGKTWAVAFPVTKPGFDPSGWTVRSEIRERAGSTSPVHVWPSTGAVAGFEQVPADQLRSAGYTVPDGTENVLCVVLRLTPAVSSAWGDTWRLGVFDVEAVSADEEDVVLVASGSVVLQREVSRSSSP